MSTLEHEIAAALHGGADKAPDDLGLLGRVQAVSRLRARRRRLAGVTCAVLAVSGIGVGVGLREPARTPVPPSVEPTAAPTPAGGFLVDGSELARRIRVSAGYLPPELDPTPQLYTVELDGYGEASWFMGATKAITDPPQVVLKVSRHRPADLPRGEHVDVLGVAGERVCSGAAGARDAVQTPDKECTVSWKKSPQEWVTVRVTSYFGATGPIAERIAGGVRDEDMVVRPFIVLGLVPRGCVLRQPQRDATVLESPDGGSSPCDVDVHLVAPGDVPFVMVKGDPVTLGGYRGVLGHETLTSSFQGSHPVGVAPPAATTTSRDVIEMSLDIGDGRRLVVTVADVPQWSTAELDRFVGAIVLPPT